MFLLEENENLIIFASEMFNLQNETFLNGLDKLNPRKVNTIKSPNTYVFLYLYQERERIRAQFMLDWQVLRPSRTNVSFELVKKIGTMKYVAVFVI